MKHLSKFILFVVVGVCFTYVSTSFAQESNERSKDAWFLLGYGYTVPSDSAVDGLMGPATLTFGGDIWRFIGLELTLGSRWRLGEETYRTLDGSSVVSAKNALWSFDIKPYLLLQPKLGIDLISIRPYFGVGPTFSISGYNSTAELIGASNSSSDTSFDVGFSTQFGVRLQALKFLFVGVGAEYMYHNPKLSGVNKNLSGFSFGGEIGLIW